MSGLQSGAELQWELQAVPARKSQHSYSVLVLHHVSTLQGHLMAKNAC
jgi:hypothetical protein